MRYVSSPASHQVTHCLKIRGCRVLAWVGIYPHEQTQRSSLIFDVDIDIDARKAAQSDNIKDTVDYASVVEVIRNELLDRRFFLVEALSDFVADCIIRRFHVSRVRLTIMKGAVVSGVEGVGVQVERFAPVDMSNASHGL